MLQRSILVILFLSSVSCSMAQYGQADSLVKGTITIHKDARIDMLGKKMAEYNESLSSKMKMVNGYRLMLLSTNDRAMAMQIRSQLLQQYSDQKVYMIFQSPYIKLKMGNYTERPEAEKMRKQLLASKIISGNIYIVSEMVEAKQDKSANSEEQP
ncbi:MAG: SPOR domain-containing protein [Ferruginibacter sp.]